MRVTENITITLFSEIHFTLMELSHVNALVCRVLYDSPARKALCYVHFADDDTSTER